MTVVRSRVVDILGLPVPGKQVTARLRSPSRWLSDGSALVVEAARATTDDDGYWEMDLTPQSRFEAGRSFYSFFIPGQDKQYAVVPDAGPVELHDILVDPTSLDPVPGCPPPDLTEPAPDLVAELLEEDPFYIAHRGSGNDHPEHTLEAYRAAVAAGAKAIEVSVLITADGALVCGHDLTTDRTTGKAGVVRELHASGLLGYPVDMREWLGPSWGTQRWPYLNEVLDEFGGRVVIFLEPKHPEAAIPCINEISRRGLQNSVVYKSHRWGTYQAIAKAEGFRVWSYLDSDTPLAEARSIAEEADFLGLPIRDDVSSMPDTPDTLIEDVVAIGKPVIVWPVSRRSAVERVTNLGVQGIMASSWIYLSRSTPVLSRDTFASGTRAPGDAPRTMVPSYQPSWDDGAIVLDHQSQQSYMLGSLCPVEADEYKIRFDLAYDSVPADGNRHSGLVFGRENDTPYEFGNASINVVGGYHLVLRADGRLQIYRHDPGVSAGVNLASVNDTAPISGEWRTFEVVVTPEYISLQRVNGTPSDIAVTNDTTYRGGYIHVARNWEGALGPVRYRNIEVIY